MNYPPTCVKPTDLAFVSATTTSATLGWTNGAEGQTAWQICLNGNENNLIMANSNPFTIENLDASEAKLQLVGVAYKAEAQGQLLTMSLGYSHNIVFEFPKEIEVNAVTEKGKDPIVTLKCNDKQLLGQVCNKIRSYRKPEPYKGKGIRFVGEVVRKKAGKSADK